MFFRRHKKAPSTDALSVLGTDIHSHLIPGIDDGAQSMEESLSLIRELQQLGYEKLITTPHCMGDRYRNTPEIILRGLHALRDEIHRHSIPVKVEAAAEYYLDADFKPKIEKRELLTFNGNMVLFEISFINAPENFMNIVNELQSAGYKPVLAHPERYPFWHGRLEEFRRFRAAGVLLEINITSFSPHCQRAIRKMAETFIELEMADMLGTDCHNRESLMRLRNALSHPHLQKALTLETLLNKSL